MEVFTGDLCGFTQREKMPKIIIYGFILMPVYVSNICVCVHAKNINVDQRIRGQVTPTGHSQTQNLKLDRIRKNLAKQSLQ